MYRTHTCGDLNKEHVGQEVTLAGWVQSRRDHGGLIFIDLRDRYGVTQVTFDPAHNEQAWKIAEELRSEFVIQIRGKVIARPEGMINARMATGAVELVGTELVILSRAKTPPFEIESDQEAPREINEERRFTYRYIDFRRPSKKKNLIVRHEAIHFIRNFLSDEGFLEVETPILTKSSPEGARDYLVPSRTEKGMFYALPQSPQQYKQLLMVGGIDKYFQVARCLRDEDARGDRQAEFTQLDMEMSFIEPDDILGLVERLFTSLVNSLNERGLITKKIMQSPWPRLSFADVMLKYGIDKPDLRFGCEIQEVNDMVRGCGFGVFTSAIDSGGVVRAIVAPGASETFSRSVIDELTEYVKKYGAKGLAYIKVIGKEGDVYALESPINKFLGEDVAQRIAQQMNAKAGDIIFFGADKQQIVEEALGMLRGELGKRLGLIDTTVLGFAFVKDFPLFEPYNEKGMYAPMHHMFTMPKPEDIPLLDSDPLKALSWQYDFICNGYEVGGGSVRIHDAALQAKIFDLIGFDDVQKQEFAHMLTAFEYGVPPHGGMAPGLDRILMLLLDEPNIREVIPFPKTGEGRDLLVGAPSAVDAKQLKELGIIVQRPTA